MIIFGFFIVGLIFYYWYDVFEFFVYEKIFVFVIQDVFLSLVCLDNDE